MKKYILFDLDGTLTESAPGIVRSIQYALRSLGVEGYTEEELEAFVGPPLVPSFINIVGLSQEEAEKALELFRERFSTIGKFENDVFDGIPDLLSNLRKAGAVLGVATSKPEQFVHEILDHFDLTKYFTYIVGATMDEKRTDKADVIAEALRQGGYEEHKDEVIMVGDTQYDIIGAKKNGVSAIGVSYGYGVVHEMRDAGADEIVHSVKALEEMLLSKC